MSNKWKKAVSALTLAAAAFSFAVAAPQEASAQVKGHLSKVQVIKKAPVYTNYKKGKKTHKYLKKGSVKKVKATATDTKKKVWIKVGTKKWIASKYTVVITTTAKRKAKSSSITKAANQAAKAANKATQAANKAAQAAKQATAALTTNQVNQAASSQAPAGSSWQQSRVVSLAKAQVGKAYVWGATGPSSFDCSGLVQWVYKNAIGKTVSRTTYTQVYEGVNVTVSTSSLQPGDILFWGNAAAPYHVAIYVGNGQYVSAADEQQGVILATLSSYYWPTVARRLL
ncbi:Cell wall-associated hydrolase [Lactobacillus equicursoris DSM 19284 = JCM 14600 = CIP 110162]|uniref:Cell wall-associated hydrolase n=1 Tax=Lactobacillus equicursoris DSM 19284 = JCM 14600 = CIP 110162 TaxID=1293597 RepID=K0NYD8_9LACO|nr:C40 family peptidase [Lactobacillus equicursoris]KRL00214.1 cell wall-associated hydrolase [Lactobacillus equicursoris DSM 19284 = JCM 14600 = CIP 110162]CCK84700.1 Cell wall-associated hydrolase [Lactobacillus equicursoris DSM 19284 = JCM 14600 = CIP 110162]